MNDVTLHCHIQIIVRYFWWLSFKKYDYNGYKQYKIIPRKFRKFANKIPKVMLLSLHRDAKKDLQVFRFRYTVEARKKKRNRLFAIQIFFIRSNLGILNNLQLHTYISNNKSLQ